MDRKLNCILCILFSEKHILTNCFCCPNKKYNIELKE